MCSGKIARRAAIFAREMCEEILIGLRNYLIRHRRTRGGEQPYMTGCGVMIDGDDDVRLHHRDDLQLIIDIDDGSARSAEDQQGDK